LISGASLFASLPDPTYIIDSGATIQQANRLGAALLGYASPADLMGVPVMRLAQLMDGKRLVANVVALLEIVQRGDGAPDMEPSHLELFFIRTNGDLLPVEASLSAVREAGECWVILTAHDVSGCLFREMFETSQDGLVYTDMDGNYLDCNPAHLKIIGYESVEEVKGRSFQEFTAPEYRQLEIDIMREQTMARGYCDEFEKEYIRKDGTRIPVSVHAWLRRDLCGEPIGMWGIVQDISARRRAEQAIREQADQYSTMLSATTDGFLLVDQTGRLIDVNEAYCQMSAYPREELVQLSIEDLEAMEDAETVRRHLQQVTQQGSDHFESRHRAKDGRIFDVQVSITVWAARGWRFVFIHDITERKQAEARLQQNMLLFENALQRLALHFSRMPLAYIVFSTDMMITEWNPAAERIFGWTAAEALGKHANLTIPPDERPITNDVFHNLIMGIEQPNVINDNITRDGRRITCAWFNAPLYDAQGEMIGILSMANDITEKMRVEAALRKSEQQFKTLTENIPDMIDRIDRDYRHIYLNPAAERLLGFSAQQWVGKRTDEVSERMRASGTVQRLRQVFETGKNIVFEMPVPAPSGMRYFLSHGVPEFGPDGSVVSALFIHREITERKQAEEQMKVALAEKETLLRELYHRTKNNMQVIMAMLELQQLYANDDRVVQIMTDMRSRIQSMALVHQKLYQSGNLSSIDLGEYIRELAALLVDSYQVRPSVRLSLDTQVIPVLIDVAIPCGLVLNELVSNAMKYAFPDGQEGEIRVSVLCDEQGKIHLTVSDSGVGLAAGFDPRQEGRLGMQTLIALVEHQLQGQISFQSRPNAGVACQVVFQDPKYCARV
jgi:PAS domain S-box-containing protein